MDVCERPLEEVIQEFGTDQQRGLTAAQVTAAREKYGRNELRREEREKWYVVLGRQFTGILIYILAFAAIISGTFGEWVDTFAILAILLINGVIGFWQEWKAQASIESLKKMASAKATVLRDGKPVQVPAEELVPGDILVLQTGDKIPADARIIEEASLETLEGALTGESTPVSKKIMVCGPETPLGEQKNMLFSGTVITKGRGHAVVIATGMDTEIGKIAHLIQEADVEETPLQKDLDALGGKLGRITLGISGIVFLVLLLFAEETFSLEALQHALETAVALAVAAIPEGLPIVVTIALAFGTQRMVKKHALIKRLASVETLGSTTVICTDKTGTLTKNEMTVTRLWHAGKDIAVTGTGYSSEGSVEGLLPRVLYEAGALCNDSELVEDEGLHVAGDPTEGCLLTLARKAGFSEEELRKQYPRIGEVPFSSERKRMSTVHDYGDQAVLLSKGAPDVVLEHCDRILEDDAVRAITDEDKQRILAQNEAYAGQALRVLGFAFRGVERKESYEEDEDGLIFIALAGMIDPPREEAKLAVKKCKTAGIRVVMITGDHIATAKAIAAELGIEGKAILGADIDDIDLDSEVEDIGVYARVNPEHKMQIIEAFQRRGEVVAMTGDGVNDAPALKHADIGVAMGIAGTDVAKESASMILTDDNFTSVVNAVEEGRAIYTNIKKFVNYLLSSNFAEILVILFSVLMFSHEGGAAVALTATMLLFMNILTDSLPALALGVDPGPRDAMQQPPRDPKAHILSRNMLYNIIFIGVLVSIATLIMFGWSLSRYGDLAHAQTMALTTLVVLEVVRLAMIRSQYKTPMFSNGWLLLAVGTVVALQVAVVYAPWLQFVFGTVALTMAEWGLIVGTAAATYVVGLLAGNVIQTWTGQRD